MMWTMRIGSINELKRAIEQGKKVEYAGCSVLSFIRGKIVTKEGEPPFKPWLPALRIVEK